MDRPVDAGREFWRGVLVAGGFTAIPRWASDQLSPSGRHAHHIGQGPGATSVEA